jgi:hypothetical protein
MQPYDNVSFEPPAPVAHVTLRNSASGVSIADVPMLLDSGADATLIPAYTLDELGLTALPGVEYELADFDGRLSSTSVVRLELLFCRRTFRGHFLIIEQTWGILGRNVLNALSLTFDGPQLLWHEQSK